MPLLSNNQDQENSSSATYILIIGFWTLNRFPNFVANKNAHKKFQLEFTCSLLVWSLRICNL
jgi:hypothetical protein